MKVAHVLVKTDIHTYVLCPYCHKPHCHGVTTANDRRSSHCLAGEYDIGEQLDFTIVEKAMVRRDKDVERKRAVRSAMKEAKSQPVK